MVTLKVGGKGIDFLVDTGATFSVLKSPVGPTMAKKTYIQGATGKTEAYPWTEGRITNLGKGTISHSFLVVLDCLYPFLGRDLLSKLKATISFQEKGQTLLTYNHSTDHQIALLVTCPLSEEYMLLPNPQNTTVSQYLKTFQEQYPQVWDESKPPGWWPTSLQSSYS